MRARRPSKNTRLLRNSTGIVFARRGRAGVFASRCGSHRSGEPMTRTSRLAAMVVCALLSTAVSMAEPQRGGGSGSGGGGGGQRTAQPRDGGGHSGSGGGGVHPARPLTAAACTAGVSITAGRTYPRADPTCSSAATFTTRSTVRIRGGRHRRTGGAITRCSTIGPRSGFRGRRARRPCTSTGSTPGSWTTSTARSSACR